MALALHIAQHRLARHYLDKLRLAAESVRRGRDSLSYGLTVFNQEWEQIKHWHGWSVSQPAADEALMRLRAEFPLIGSDILAIRQNPRERVAWLETALDAARQLGDGESERSILFQLYQAYFTLNALDDAERCAHTLLDAAQSAGDRLYTGRAIYALAAVQEERGDYPQASDGYQRCLSIFEKLGAVSDISGVMNGLGSVAIYLGDYQQAHDYFQRHLALAEALGQQSETCRALLALSQGALGLDDLPAAQDYTRRAITLARALGSQRNLGIGLLTLGQLAVEQGDLEIGRVHLEEGVQAVRAAASERNVIHGLSTLGYVYFRLGSFVQALEHYAEALDMARRSGLPRFVCNLLRNMANAHLALADLDSAAVEIREGLALAQTLGSDSQKRRTLCSAIDLWRRRGLPEQAAIWIALVIDADDIDRPLVEPIFAHIESALGVEHYRRALEQGHALSLDNAVSQVLALLDPPPSPLPLAES